MNKIKLNIQRFVGANNSTSLTAPASSTYKYTLAVAFTENSHTASNNTSNVTCAASLSANNIAYNDTGGGTLAVYWHDNRQNTDVLVASAAVNKVGASYGTASVSGTFDVTHNSDGNLSGYAYAYFTKNHTNSYIPASGGVQTAWTALSYNQLATAPTLSSVTISNITEKTASVSYSVTSDGGATVTAQGIQYKLSTASSWSTGSASLTNLTPNTKYDVRAYATNSVGTTYSTTSFTTYAYPTVSSISNWTIGGSTTVTFTNPRNQTVNLYIKQNNTSGTTLWSGTATGTSKTITPTASTCYNTLTNAASGTAVAYVVFGGNTSATKSATYSIGTATATYRKDTTTINNNFTVSNGSSLTASLSTNPSGAGVKYFIDLPAGTRRITQTSGSFTLAQVGSLSAYIPTTNSQSIRIGVVTLDKGGHERLYSYIDGTYNVVNSDPTFTSSNISWTDANSTVSSVTGGSVLVNTLSKLNVAIQPMTFKNGANSTNAYYTISFGNLSNTGVSYSSSSQTVSFTDPVNTSTGQQALTVKAYDSRGNNTTAQITGINVIPYSPISDNTTAVRTNGFESETKITIKGTYSKVTVGSTRKNSITNISYYYKKSTDSTWTTGSTNVAFTSGDASGTDRGSYTANSIYTHSFNNEYAYNVKVVVTESLGSKEFIINVPEGKPILWVSASKKNVGIGGKNDGGEYSLKVTGAIVGTSTISTSGNISASGNLTVQGNTTLNKSDSGVVKVLGTAGNGSFRTRVVNGITSDGTAYDDLHLQYGANKLIKLGNTAAYTISADGSTYSGTSAVANKLGTSTVGSSDRPIYLNGGTATQVNTPASGNYFRGVPFISSGGVMEVGRYIDFHPTNGSTLDYSKRIDAGTGTTARTITIPDESGTMQLKPTALYNNATGTTGTITLSQSAANFTFIRVYYRDMDSACNSVDIYSPNGKTARIGTMQMDTINTLLWIQAAEINFSGTSLKFYNSRRTSHSSNYSAIFFASDQIWVTRVDGWK